jgi:ribonucleoside-diphosphate reductase beta chain
MSVINLDNTTGYSSGKKLFLGERLSIARYDMPVYPQLSILNEKMKGFFWNPEEITLVKDVKDFRDLSAHEQHIFTSNIKRQILLDSVQGRAPVEGFLPTCSNPELEAAIISWTMFEQIHSLSYTFIIRNIYANPSKVFDEVLDIKEIVDCAKDISKYYDELHAWNVSISPSGKYIQETYTPRSNCEYTHKKTLWMALNAVNALEGVRFYASFACSYAFAENKKMEGNAKIIKLINRDENVHLALTQKLIQLLPESDKDFEKISKEMAKDCKEMFEQVVEQEKVWADYLFKDGSMIGLNAHILKEFLEFIARRRMKAIGIDCDYTVAKNPLPWIDKWIAGSEVQNANQEVQNTQYIIGGIKNDVGEDTFKGLTL